MTQVNTIFYSVDDSGNLVSTEESPFHVDSNEHGHDMYPGIPSNLTQSEVLGSGEAGAEVTLLGKEMAAAALWILVYNHQRAVVALGPHTPQLSAALAVPTFLVLISLP